MKELWLFDINRRVYRRDSDGRATGGPIWREHWRRWEVVGETAKSWVLRSGKKVSKKGGPGIAFSEVDIDREGWVVGNRHLISHAVSRVESHDLLKQIASLIGYQEGT